MCHVMVVYFLECLIPFRPRDKGERLGDSLYNSRSKRLTPFLFFHGWKEGGAYPLPFLKSGSPGVVSKELKPLVVSWLLILHWKSSSKGLSPSSSMDDWNRGAFLPLFGLGSPASVSERVLASWSTIRCQVQLQKGYLPLLSWMNEIGVHFTLFGNGSTATCSVSDL